MTELIPGLASLSPKNPLYLNVLQTRYQLPDHIPLSLLSTLAAAEDAIARLDERLAKSPIRDGWIARTHLSDAAASLWLEGELIPIEDLVLHDERMDVRVPSHALTRAHAVLRSRRRIMTAEPGWALSPVGLGALRGQLAANSDAAIDPVTIDAGSRIGNTGHGVDDTDVVWAAEMAAIDALLTPATASSKSHAPRSFERDALFYDLDWDEDERIAAWRLIVEQTTALPPTLAAAVAFDAWTDLSPLQHLPWLGRLLAPAVLSARVKTRAHLLCFNTGLRAIRQRRGRLNLQTILEAMIAGAHGGLADHDRWLLARQQLERKLRGRRANSKLPALVDLVLATPIASAGMIAEKLSVTPRAAQDMVVMLGLREVTGRGRYRAWGIL